MCIEIRFIRLALEQVVGVGDAAEPVDNSVAIAEIQEQLHGHYDPELYRSALKEKIDIIAGLDVAPGLAESKALLLDELDAYLGAEPVRQLEHPDGQTLTAVRDWIDDQFGDLFAAIDAEGIEQYDADGIARMFRLAIDTTPALRNTGWEPVVLNKEKNVISVAVGKHQIMIPVRRKVGPLKLKKLLVHEVLGHALRSAVAESNGSNNGAQGTATYSRFEESFEIAMEQCVDGAVDINSKLNGYIAIGLSVTQGLSRERIAHIFRSIHMLTGAKGSGISPAVRSKADERTILQLQRTFEGMTDVDDGIANRRDINYLHGLDGAWRLLNHMVQTDCLDQGMRWLLSAKFNPYDADDRRLVEHINQSGRTPCPMPAELQEFFDLAA